jgi:hypothetical protein
VNLAERFLDGLGIREIGSTAKLLQFLDRR